MFLAIARFSQNNLKILEQCFVFLLPLTGRCLVEHGRGLEGSFKGASSGLQRGFRRGGLRGRPQEGFKGASRGLEGGLKGASKGLQGGLKVKGASSGLEGGFKGA